MFCHGPATDGPTVLKSQDGVFYGTYGIELGQRMICPVPFGKVGIERIHKFFEILVSGVRPYYCYHRLYEDPMGDGLLFILQPKPKFEQGILAVVGYIGLLFSNGFHGGRELKRQFALGT